MCEKNNVESFNFDEMSIEEMYETKEKLKTMEADINREIESLINNWGLEVICRRRKLNMR